MRLSDKDKGAVLFAMNITKLSRRDRGNYNSLFLRFWLSFFVLIKWALNRELNTSPKVIMREIITKFLTNLTYMCVVCVCVLLLKAISYYRTAKSMALSSWCMK